MKKLKIAALGVAALGFAAAPAGLTFAANEYPDTTSGPTAYTDTVEVTINKSCLFGRGTAYDFGETAFEGDHHAGKTDVSSWGTGDVLSGSIDAGGVVEGYGSSNFTVVCNNEDGWQVTALAEALTGKTTGEENIPLGTPGADVAAWNAVSASEDADVDAGITVDGDTEVVVASSEKTTETAGRTFTMTYNVSVDHELSAQTYSGQITYTFAQLPLPESD